MALTCITPESANRICCLVTGKYGLGKTSLLRTMLGQEWNDETMTWETLHDTHDTDDKVCVLSAESGLLAVRDLVVAGRVEGFEIGSFEEFAEAYDLLASSEDMKGRYKWIFIDSLTEISSRCDIVMRERYPDQSKAFRRWDDYAATMQTTIKGFRDLKEYNVVFTCLETIEKDDNNRRYVSPDVKGRGLKEQLPSYFDETFYMVIEEGRRVFLTQPYGDYPAKDRSGKLNPVEMPNLLTIKNKILGGV